MTPEATIDHLRERIFHMSVQTAEGAIWSATCFYIARLLPSNRIVVATAAHAVKFSETTKIDWVFRRFTGDGSCVAEMRFSTNDSEELKRPYRFYKLADVAFIVLPPPDYEAHGELIPTTLEPAMVLEQTKAITPGTRVGWMGFPGTVEAFLGAPQLCYYEGVVSAFHAKGSRGLYLVDGHNSRGVSGGPVFHWRDGDHQPQIVGIVSGYGCEDADLPGLCVFEPINPVIGFLKAQYGTEPRDAKT
jgi:hypothetical protein